MNVYTSQMKVMGIHFFGRSNYGMIIEKHGHWNFIKKRFNIN